MPESLSIRSTETQLKLLRAISEDTRLSQRDLASLLGMSLGKVNYSLKGLVGKGLVRVHTGGGIGGHGRRYSVTRSGRRVTFELMTSSLARKKREIRRIQLEVAELVEQLSTMKGKFDYREIT